MKLKVCGLRDNIQEVEDLKPAFMGFIFYAKSPRFVGNDFVLPHSISAQKVGVFVNQPLDDVLAMVKKHGLDLIQLHGTENIDYCVELKAHGIQLIKVFAGNKLPNQAELDAYSGFVDYYLFDTQLDKHGGNGVAFNWMELHKLAINKPLIISGGIGPNNIYDLMQTKLDVFAIDVNSKVEIQPGLKSIEKLKELKNILARPITQ